MSIPTSFSSLLSLPQCRVETFRRRATPKTNSSSESHSTASSSKGLKASFSTFKPLSFLSRARPLTDSQIEQKIQECIITTWINKSLDANIDLSKINIEEFMGLENEVSSQPSLTAHEFKSKNYLSSATARKDNNGHQETLKSDIETNLKNLGITDQPKIDEYLLNFGQSLARMQNISSNWPKEFDETRVKESTGELIQHSDLITDAYSKPESISTVFNDKSGSTIDFRTASFTMFSGLRGKAPYRSVVQIHPGNSLDIEPRWTVLKASRKDSYQLLGVKSEELENLNIRSSLSIKGGKFYIKNLSAFYDAMEVRKQNYISELLHSHEAVPSKEINTRSRTSSVDSNHSPREESKEPEVQLSLGTSNDDKAGQTPNARFPSNSASNYFPNEAALTQAGSNTVVDIALPKAGPNAETTLQGLSNSDSSPNPNQIPQAFAPEHPLVGDGDSIHNDNSSDLFLKNETRATSLPARDSGFSSTKNGDNATNKIAIDECPIDSFEDADSNCLTGPIKFFTDIWHQLSSCTHAPKE
ncbi:MAG: hypothetical protein V4629_03860 [Pseudomonadota bacterium]